MYQDLFDRFAPLLERVGAQGKHASEFVLDMEGAYELRYIPFDYINPEARLIIVGITPGPNQIGLAYDAAQKGLANGQQREQVLAQIKQTGGFGGATMRPNLLRMLRHFSFDRLLGIEDVATLWAANAHLLHATSVVTQAAFENGKPFNGKFDAIMKSAMLRQCFIEGFVASISRFSDDAMYIALGDTPKSALDWCVSQGYLRRDQVLGAFCHPSSSGGSATAYYLREKGLADLSEKDPIRSRVATLDRNYQEMLHSVKSRLGEAPLVEPAGANIDAPALVMKLHKDDANGGREKRKRQSNVRVNLTKVDASTSETEMEQIIDSIAQSVGQVMNRTKKVVELQTRSGQMVYFIKAQSRLNHIVMAVHPELESARLWRMDGVESVSDDYRFHSNMREFPKRLNKGDNMTHYGRHVIASSLDDCRRFLAAL